MLVNTPEVVFLILSNLQSRNMLLGLGISTSKADRLWPRSLPRLSFPHTLGHAFCMRCGAASAFTWISYVWRRNGPFAVRHVASIESPITFQSGRESLPERLRLEEAINGRQYE